MQIVKPQKELWLVQLEQAIEQSSQIPKYQAIAGALEKKIQSGSLNHNDQLPTVREVSQRLGVSGTTVASAYRLLTQKGLIISRVGSGTRVVSPRPEPSTTYAAPSSPSTNPPPWRRRAQTFHINHLKTAFPSAVNYASGTPNPSLLPAAILKRAWRAAVEDLTAETLRYTGPAPVDALACVLIPRLKADFVPARASDLVVGSSAQQLMTLSAKVVSALTQTPQLKIAVEEPGYPTIFDTYERLGHQLIGVQVDNAGLMPSALDHALSQGAMAALVTPRAHNPTGVSWTQTRLQELADVFDAYPNVVIIEDDQIADATNVRPGSLMTDPRLENRVIYIRSFSKAIAPDLRLAVAVARPHLRALLMEEKFYADGWSSTLAQMALANAFADPELSPFLASVSSFYAKQRHSLTQAITAEIKDQTDIRVGQSVDGPNIWLQLPRYISATAVAERTAAAGILVAIGEPFFINIGRDDALRVNAGMIAIEDIDEVGRQIAAAALEVANSTSGALFHHSL